ncbi:MAG: hypothetical protein JSR82_20895 [Verrucomicrobia bacterium]|nr:hypothetical protein [Verrucomicrobiota bacterium]
MRRLRVLGSLLVALGVFFGCQASAQRAELTPEERLRAEQNWREEQIEHDRVLAAATDWLAPETRRAVEGGIACALRLEQPDDALKRAQRYIERTKGHFEEAVGLRLLGGLYLKISHEGMVRAGRWQRGNPASSTNDIFWESDRAAAVQAYERARELLAARAAEPPAEPQGARPDRAGLLRAERIGLNFDLVVALSSRVWREQPDFLRHWVSPSKGEVRPPGLAEPDDEIFRRRLREPERFPAGLVAGTDGAPQFPAAAAAYSSGLSPAAKARFLLEEIERLDDSPERNDAALALKRRAALAVETYDSPREEWVRQVRDMAIRVGQPLPALPEPRTLGDEEFLIPVEGVLRVVRLPADEQPLALAALVESRFPRSRSVGAARLLRADFLAGRRQYDRALAEYRSQLGGRHPSPETLEKRIADIERPQVSLDAGGTYYPGEKPWLSFKSRRATKVLFKALPFDLARFVQQRAHRPHGPEYFSSWLIYGFYEGGFKPYVGAVEAQWSEPAPAGGEYETREGRTAAPLTKPGTWLIEARVEGGEKVARTLIHVTDLALVEKNVSDGRLVWVVDARSGRPLADIPLQSFERESFKGDKLQRADLRSGPAGLAFYRSKSTPGYGSDICTLAGAEKRLAFTYLRSFSGASRLPADTVTKFEHAVTDRPIYRPGQTVKFRIWQRKLQYGRYLPPRAGESISYEIGPEGEREDGKYVKTDDHGGYSGEFVLPQEAKLGLWTLEVERSFAVHFRVEEYKRPEFEVTVQPATPLGRLGQKFQATISARYYFGAPVTEAEVVYRVFRQAYRVDPPAGPFDWLYGPGYGLGHYEYPWLGMVSSPRWWERRPERELVQESRAELRADGTCEVEIDTARARAQLGDRDHIYLIEAEVRDASRRTIEGRGSIIATREEFHVHVESSRGWYGESDTATISVVTRTATNVPVAASGELLVVRYRFSGPRQERVEEEIVRRLPAATDPQGRYQLEFPLPGEGQYAVRFVTRDSARAELKGQAVFWVRGPKFDGTVQRFHDLEIITDKREYRVGETARLLIQAADSTHVLFHAPASSDNSRLDTRESWRVLPLPNRTTVVEIPITARHAPNFYVEAVLVRAGRIQDTVRELIVPPTGTRLTLQVQSDKPSYGPGEKGRLRLSARDEAGRPTSGEIALSVFDRSLTYFTRDLPRPNRRYVSFGRDDGDGGAPGPLASFHGQRAWPPEDWQRGSSVRHDFGTGGFVQEPGPRYHWTGVPPWSLEEVGLRLGGSLSDPEKPGALERDDRADRDRASFPGRLDFESARPQRVIVTGSYVPEGPAPAALSAFQAAAWNGPEPTVRTDFSETALWLPRLALNEQGEAEAEVTFPEALTTWQIKAEALSLSTAAGEASGSVTTSRSFLVRLQAPRFFVERDEVVLSAIVNSSLPEEQPVRAELLVPAALFASADAKPAADGHLSLTAEAPVRAQGEHRFEWRLKVRQAGLAHLTVKAVAPSASDAMRLAFPVEVHGVEQQVALSGSLRPGQSGERVLEFDVPADIDTARTELVVTLSPSLANVLVEALPYLLAYPYGCTEQTVSRFYPAAVVAQALRRFGTDLESIGRQRGQLPPDQLRRRYGTDPVFRTAELERVVRAGSARLSQLQQSGGGWGWWQNDGTSLALTAYVLDGLYAARQAGAKIDGRMLERGASFLRGEVERALREARKRPEIAALHEEPYLAYVLALGEMKFSPALFQWLDEVFQQRARLPRQGLAQLALALHRVGRSEQAALALRNLLQFVERDDAEESAWIRFPETEWWFWWNNGTETNAWALRALLAIQPGNELVPRVAKWLLSRRYSGVHWRSTRETAVIVRALSEYLVASGEAAPDLRVSVGLDTQPARELRLTRENLFHFDHRLVFPAALLPPGRHMITLGKQGTGALYYAATLRYLNKEEDVRGKGRELSIRRQYFKLVPEPRTVTTAADRPGTTREEQRSSHRRVPLATGETVASGDLIEVELHVTAKHRCEYLAFEDPKPAGCESVALVSGQRWAHGWCSNVELRDSKIVFFVPLLEQGEHVLRYRLRAEIPGHFHALPTTGYAMYAPEIQATSDEMRVQVK